MRLLRLIMPIQMRMVMGASDTGTSLCSDPADGKVTNNTDCDDNDNTVYPGAPELCDGKDNDCDTVIDNGLTFTTYYADSAWCGQSFFR